MGQNHFKDLLRVKYGLLDLLLDQEFKIIEAHRSEIAEESDTYFKLDCLYKTGVLPMNSKDNEELVEKAFYNGKIKDKIKWKISPLKS